LGYESSSERDFSELRGQERASRKKRVLQRLIFAPLTHPEDSLQLPTTKQQKLPAFIAIVGFQGQLT
jgi:hypothetical protein